MLAKAPPAPPPPISSEFRRNGTLFRTPLPFSHGYFHLRSYSNSSNNNNNSNGCMKWRKRDDSRVLVVVRAGYTRRQMETVGAYELIDDETGEKFIVWGDDDKDNTTSSIPSKDVLHWKPSNNINKSNKNRSSSKNKSSNVVSGSNSSSEDENNNNNNNIKGSSEA